MMEAEIHLLDNKENFCNLNEPIYIHFGHKSIVILSFNSTFNDKLNLISYVLKEK